MEGLSGQDDPYSFLYGHPEYPRGQRLLIQDVNAVIEGLFAGGAGSVTVADGHGSGNPGQNPVRITRGAGAGGSLRMLLP